MAIFQHAFELLTLLDWAALLFFIMCFRGYGWLVDADGRFASRGLVQKTHHYRERWARELILRNNRVADSNLISNLIGSVSFYANTTIYVIAGLFAVLGTMDQLITIASDLPFSRNVSKAAMELKLVLVLAVFVIAYFKFTWSLRQFNLFTILVGGAPDPSSATPEQIDRYALRMAKINTLAGEEFNRGVRAYYFALASTTWMLHPVMLIAASLMIIVVLVRRDFYSQALEVLS